MEDFRAYDIQEQCLKNLCSGFVTVLNTDFSCKLKDLTELVSRIWEETSRIDLDVNTICRIEEKL